MNSEIICIAAASLPEEHSSFLTAYISKKLFELGHRTTFESFSSPKTDEIEKLLNKALSRSDLIIVLGGIEPENNSVSKRALSSVTALPLVANEEALRSVKEYCMSIGADPTPEQLSAGIIPQGAEVFKNELGLCPGLALDHKGKKLLLLPYAEGELTHMFESYAVPMLSPHGINITHTVNVIGLTLEEIEVKLSSLQGRSEFAVIPEKHGAECAVRVSAVASSKAEAEKICMRAVASVKFALGKAAFAVDSKGLQFEVVNLLSQKGLTVSTAESCTAGMVSEMLTDVSGSSRVFEYGISAYSNRIKCDVLKVPEEVLEKYTAISAETAKYMAVNVKTIGNASIGVGITGNAGPTASEGKPVGLVYVAIADSNSYIVSELKLSDKLSRDEIREIASAEALNLVRRYASAYPDAMPGMFNYTPEAVLTETKTAIDQSAAALPHTEPTAPSTFADSDNEGFYTETASTPPTEKDESLPLYDESSAFRFDRVEGEDFIAEEYRFANSGRISETAHTLLKKLSAFACTVFPCRGDSKKKVFIKIGFIVSLLTFVTSATMLFIQLTADNTQRNIITEAQQSWNFDGSKDKDNNFTAFKPFYKENEDIQGWLSISGTNVNNPVYQTVDNDFYLTHNMYKEKSRYGALFFDYRCNVSSSAPSQNMIIYGHEMKDGSMFGTLKRYKSLAFYKTNPTINLTLQDEQAEYKIFSVMVMNATPADDNGYMFNYINPTFKTQKTFLAWVSEACERSIINTSVDVKEDDTVLTLVTCINDFDNARFVVMARKTRADESNGVNVEEATLNPNPRYPQAWYDKRGLEGFAGSSAPEASNGEASTEAPSGEEPSASESEVGTSSPTDSSSTPSDSTQNPSAGNNSSSSGASTGSSSDDTSSDDVSSGSQTDNSESTPSESETNSGNQPNVTE